MAQTNIVAGLDIGSQNIRIAVGEVTEESSKLNIIGIAEGVSNGVSKGTVRSLESVVESIGNVVAKAEKMVGLGIDHATISISGSHITSQDSKGVIAISRADGEIREDDVDRVLEAAQAVSVPPNYEILHVIPRSFSIDNQSGVKDPIGMNGVRLEVEAQIIEGQSAHVKNITKAVNMAGVNIDDLVLAALASSETTLTERQKDLGVALVNIGAATTSLLVFEEGDIIKLSVLPVGSSHITNDIAIGLRTNVDVAEEVKIQYGHALPDQFSKADDIDMRMIDEQEEGQFSRKHLVEIVEARLEEIFHFVDKELRDVGRSGKLPAGIVLTGGGAKLPGIVEVAKRQFRLPASIGLPLGIDSAIDKINDPSLTTAVGLALWGYSNHLMPSGGFGGGGLGKGVGYIKEQVTSIIKIFRP